MSEPVRLEAITTIAGIGALQAQLITALDHDDISIDIGDVNQIDTASVQLLASFASTCEQIGKPISWVGDNEVFKEITTVLGLSSISNAR